MTKHLLPTPSEIKQIFPCSDSSSRLKAQLINHASQAFNLDAKRKFFAVVGPCSLHDSEEALEYAEKLCTLSKKLKHITVVMRAYIEKPRSTIGYKGIVYQPDPLEKEDLKVGLTLSRKLLCKLSKILPLAIEMVDPYLSVYFDDLISWAFIGARTSSSQIHRQIASSLPFPVGFKNSVDGNIQTAIDASECARHPHHYFHISQKGHLTDKQSSGNPMTHVVLRGSETDTNYDKESLLEAFKLQHTFHSPILIDCSHGNSSKNIQNQKNACLEVIEYLSTDLPILGIMLESYLSEGSQSLDKSALKKGLSITDPCIDFKTTESLLLYADQALEKQKQLTHHLL